MTAPRHLERRPQREDVAPFAVATFDVTGACLEANAAWARLHGVDVEAIGALTWADAVVADDRRAATVAFEGVVRGTRREVTLRALRPDGTPFAFEATLVPRRAATGATDGFHVFEHPARPVAAAPAGAEDPDDPRGPKANGNAVSPGAAARALGVSISTVRRWIDDGRLEASRTAGGHRRVSEAELRRVAGTLVRPTRLRGPRLPEHPLPALAALLAARGAALVADAARHSYEDGAVGWFGQQRAAAPLRVWVRRVSWAAGAGVPQDAVLATKDMFAEARAAAGLEECQVFADRFSALVLQATAGTAPAAVADARVLLAAMRRSLATSEDERG